MIKPQKKILSVGFVNDVIQRQNLPSGEVGLNVRTPSVNTNQQYGLTIDKGGMEMEAIDRLKRETNVGILKIWEALKKYDPNEPGPYGCPTMEDWAECVYSEKMNRGI